LSCAKFARRLAQHLSLHQQAKVAVTQPVSQDSFPLFDGMDNFDLFS
jgi:hypothetical protein